MAKKATEKSKAEEEIVPEEEIFFNDCGCGFDGEYPVAKVGELAPYFFGDAYFDGDFKEIGTKDYLGKWLILFFYPLDFTFVCPTEVKGFSDAVDRFRKEGAEILGCSVDSKYSHKAWVEQLCDVKYPLLSDITKDISADYGVLVEEEGVSLRGLFIIDPDGILRYQVVHDENVGRSVDETLRVLCGLKSGGLCPMNWKPGDKNL